VGTAPRRPPFIGQSGAQHPFLCVTLLDGKHDQGIVGERLFDLLRRNVVQRDVPGIGFVPV